MGFVIERQTKRSHKPEGNYLVIEGIEYLIQDITISASGKVCLKLHDPARKDNQIKTLCSLEELVNATLPGTVYVEY
jgi:hypothetical protein